MEKLRKMNKAILRKNLELTIEEFKSKVNGDFKESQFIINAVTEKNKPLNSRDDFMKSGILNSQNIEGRVLDTATVINILGGMVPFVPIWINISLIEVNEGLALFNIDTSLRFRKPSLLRNIETGHPPFKAVIDNE